MGWQQRAGLALSVGLLLTHGCSEGKKQPISPVDRRFTPSKVKPSVVVPSQLVTTPVFYFYDKKQGRLSVIDGENGKELAGYGIVGDFERSLYRKDSNTYFLLSSHQMLLRDQYDSKTFPLAEGAITTNWTAADDASAFAFMDPNGIKLIYGLSGEAFREQMIPATGTSQDVRAFAFSPDGQLLVQFFPNTGAYDLLHYDQAKKQYAMSQSCAGKEGFAQVPSAVAVTNDGIMLWGSEDGTLYYRSSEQGQACAALTDVPQQKVADNQAVSRIRMINGEVFALTLDGKLQAYKMQDGTFKTSVTQENLCAYPIDFYYLDADRWAIFCFEVIQAGDEGDIHFKNFLIKSKVGVKVFDAEKVQTLAADPEHHRLFVNFNSSFGQYQLISLETGVVQETKGQYADGWLDRL